MTHGMNRRRVLGQIAAVLGGMVGTARAWGASAPQPRKTPSGDLLETVGKGDMPSFATKGGPRVVQGYRDAAANGEVLQYIPCFCGCGNIGHRSNADCYVTERHADGRITYNSHAAT
jgi:hypothetical protein